MCPRRRHQSSQPGDEVQRLQHDDSVNTRDSDRDASLKGTTKPTALKFTLNGAGATAQFAGNLTINRFDFNVGEGWNDTSWVAQDVAVDLKLDLKK